MSAFPRSLRETTGQATVELVAALPLVAIVALASGQLLAAGAAHELADQAARAGAVALVQGGDPERAARAAVPGWTGASASVVVRGRRVTVALRPATAIPGVASLLTARASAVAGP